MILSMTGFGGADGLVGGGRVSVEVRSVNHRFFTPTLKLSGQLSRWEAEVRELLRQRVIRGHVTLSARFEREDEDERPTAQIDAERFGAYVAQLRALEEQFRLSAGVQVGDVLRLPDLIVAKPRVELPADAGAELLVIVERAIGALLEMRAAEGRRLADYLEERLALVEASLDRIGERAPMRLVEQRDRLRTAVRELTEGLAVDEQRLAQEIAILADRLDVQEELSRFRAHVAAFRDTLNEAPADGIGKRLGFVLQEMLRETNTTGSKASDTAILGDVLSIKEELERMREQVENLA